MNQTEKAKKKFLEFSHWLEAKIVEESGTVENKHTWTRIKVTFPEKKEATIDIIKTGNNWSMWFETKNNQIFVIEDDNVSDIMLSAQDSTEHKTYINLSEINEVSETG